MGFFRAFLRRHLAIAFVAAGLALCLKALVPPGYMPSFEGRVLTVSICHDATAGGTESLRRIVVPRGHGDEVPGKPGKGECPYGSLAMVALGGADPVLLSAAMAFILALGLAAVALAPLERLHHLRPPLRGPPLAS